jgi:hypothetical protein
MSLVLNVEILGEFKKLTQATKGSQKALTGLQKSAKSISSKINGSLALIGVGFSMGAVVKGINESIEAASDLQQQFGALDSVFKDLSPAMKSFAETLAPIGLSSADASRNMALLGAQLQGFGMDTAEAARKTQLLTLLAADLAATFGGTTSDAVGALGSLFRGEFDPIERYGVAIKKSDINARLAAEGLDGLTGEALKQAEAQAALSLLFEKTADAQGQAARESESYASQQAYLRAESENLKAQLGEALMPVMIELFKTMRDSLPEIKALVQQFINFIPILVGFAIQIIEAKDTLIPLTLGITGLGLAIKAGTVAWSAYKIVAAGVTAINASIAASNTAIATTAGTATAATGTLIGVLRTALALAGALGAAAAIISIPGSSPLPGTVPSTTRPDPIERTPFAPDQPATGIPGFGAPLPTPTPGGGGGGGVKPLSVVNNNINVNIKNANATGNEIAKAINREIRTVGNQVIRAF